MPHNLHDLNLSIQLIWNFHHNWYGFSGGMGQLLLWCSSSPLFDNLVHIPKRRHGKSFNIFGWQIFTELALWPIQSISRDVRPSVCASVCLSHCYAKTLKFGRKLRIIKTLTKTNFLLGVNFEHITAILVVWKKLYNNCVITGYKLCFDFRLKNDWPPDEGLLRGSRQNNTHKHGNL